MYYFRSSTAAFYNVCIVFLLNRRDIFAFNIDAPLNIGVYITTVGYKVYLTVSLDVLYMSTYYATLVLNVCFIAPDKWQTCQWLLCHIKQVQ